MKHLFLIGSLLLVHAVMASPAVAQSASQLAVELGLTPEALVMADVSTQSAELVLDRIDAASTERTSLAAAHTACDTTAANLAALRNDLQAAPHDDDVQDDVLDAETALADALTDLSEAQSDLFDAATIDLTSAVAQAISAIDESLWRRVPTAFTATSRTDDVWKQLERAVVVEARAIRKNQSVPNDVATLLVDVRSETAVQLAQSRLDTGHAAMQSVFEDHVPE